MSSLPDPPPPYPWTPAEDETGYLYFSNGSTNGSTSEWAHEYISKYKTPYVVSNKGILTVDRKNYIQDKTGAYEGYYKIMLPPPKLPPPITWTSEYKCVRKPCDPTTNDFETIYTSNHVRPITISSTHIFTEKEKNDIKTNPAIRSQYPPELVQGIINPSTEKSLQKLLQSVEEDEDKSEKQRIIKHCFKNSDNINMCIEDVNDKCKGKGFVEEQVCAGLLEPEMAKLKFENNLEAANNASRNSIKWFQKDERSMGCGENNTDCPRPSAESQYWDQKKKEEQKLQTELDSMCKEDCSPQAKINKDEKEKKLKKVQQTEHEYQQEYCCKDTRAITNRVCEGKSTCSIGGGKTRRYKRTTRKGCKGATRKGKTRQRTTRTGTKKVGKRM